MTVVRRTRYHWPDVQLNFWILVFLAASSTLLGIFAQFMSIQSQMQLGTPWYVRYRFEYCVRTLHGFETLTGFDLSRYMPFWVVTGALGVLFVLLIIGLVSNRQLIPGVVFLGSFILFVLFLTGLIRIAIELFGAQADVNNYCNQYVQRDAPRGPTVLTLAYLQQNNICTSNKPSTSMQVVT